MRSRLLHIEILSRLAGEDSPGRVPVDRGGHDDRVDGVGMVQRRRCDDEPVDGGELPDPLDCGHRASARGCGPRVRRGVDHDHVAAELLEVAQDVVTPAAVTGQPDDRAAHVALARRARASRKRTSVLER